MRKRHCGIKDATESHNHINLMITPNVTRLISKVLLPGMVSANCKQCEDEKEEELTFIFGSGHVGLRPVAEGFSF